MFCYIFIINGIFYITDNLDHIFMGDNLIIGVFFGNYSPPLFVEELNFSVSLRSSLLSENQSIRR